MILTCHESLVELFIHSRVADEIIRPGEVFGSYHAHIPLMSLPRIFRTTLATVPAEVPYLATDARRIERWRAEIKPGSGFCVGIAWQCKNLLAADYSRSASLDAFAPLATVPGVRLFSLQKDPNLADLASAPLPITDLGSRFVTFADTAAAIANLDLVVSVDTSPAAFVRGPRRSHMASHPLHPCLALAPGTPG